MTKSKAPIIALAVAAWSVTGVCSFGLCLAILHDPLRAAVLSSAGLVTLVPAFLIGTKLRIAGKKLPVSTSPHFLRDVGLAVARWGVAVAFTTYFAFASLMQGRVGWFAGSVTVGVTAAAIAFRNLWKKVHG